VGEGPLWDAQEQALYFVDLFGQLLFRHDPNSGTFKQWKMPQPIAAATLTASGGMLVALADGFYAFDRASTALTPRARPTLATGTQFNDGKVDRQGRFLAGSMERTMKVASGALFRLDGQQTREVDTGFVIANGPCWSPDGRTFYCSDSIPHLIYAYDYDTTTGAASNRRVFANTQSLGGIPDGATVDARGRMWMAICGGGKIVAFAPDGSVDQLVEMPTQWVSSVMFGGRELDRLYVTSLDPTAVGFPPDEQAGYLYVIEGLEAKGLPEVRAID
jgi:sugar lactone lactonase YvrE